MKLFDIWMTCVVLSAVICSALVLIDRISKLRWLKGMRVINDCECKGRKYLEILNLRLIIENGKVVGWYDPS